MIQIGKIKPLYDLWKLKRLISKQETRHIGRECRRTAVKIGFASVEEIVDAVLKLSGDDFYKTMPSEKIPGTFQDVYKKKINGVKIYIKLQENPKGRGVVISFKKDTGEEK